MFQSDREVMLPEGKPEVRLVQIGGRTSAELLTDLDSGGIKLNEHAKTLLTSGNFKTDTTPRRVAVVVISVRDLGLPHGSGVQAILANALERSLCLCPMELAPHFRLQYRNQPEGSVGHPATQQKAPPGSITVASEPIAAESNFPKGFYLRRIEGVPWLRGYRSDNEHIWHPDDYFAFCQV
jgi:hypothetical protein